MNPSHPNPRRPLVAITGASIVLAVSTAAPSARAACCSGFTQQCAGTKSVWCVQNGAPAGTLPQAFCPYGDEVVTELETLFGVQAPDIFQFDVDWPPTGGAHTSTECGTFGDSVTGDAFTNQSYGVTGFYGYLLALHEGINDWTGLSTPGWPTDYWADHVSGFPNEMDWRIMGTLGASLNDPNLVAASPAQKARFWPGGDSEDSRVQMFDQIFVLPKMGDGYQGFSRIFGYVRGDGLNWDGVATGGANPDERRSEYVAAYLSLGAGQSVLPILQHPAAGYSATTSWAVCAGQWDGVNGDPNPSYTCSEQKIDAIATAHCAIAANGKPAADLMNLQSGNYAGVQAGPCGATCPSECGCKKATNQCVAPWLADVQAGDAGGGSDGGGASDGGGGGSDSGSGSGGGGGSGSSSGSGSGDVGGGGAGDGGGNGASGGSGSSGCGCSVLGQPSGSRIDLLAAGVLGIALLRRRGRWLIGGAVALVAAEGHSRVEPRWIACGALHCDARTSYCEIFLSDVPNPPTDYFCRSLPTSCLPDSDGVAPGCDCFPAGTRCASFCGPLPTASGALEGFHLTCQGKRPPDALPM